MQGSNRLLKYGNKTKRFELILGDNKIDMMKRET